jgi:hypothetical protein
MELIDKQTAIDTILGQPPELHYPSWYAEQIRQLPSAGQKRGKWMTSYLDHEVMGVRPKILYCSGCNQCIAYPTNFCPNCGAQMER